MKKTAEREVEKNLQSKEEKAGNEEDSESKSKFQVSFIIFFANLMGFGRKKILNRVSKLSRVLMNF